MLRKPALSTLLLGAAGVFAASTAQAERGSYRGPHPIPAELPGSFCHINASHTHTYTPAADAEGFVVLDQSREQREFAGDPTGLGYEGPMIAYGEPHPMQFKKESDAIEVQCSIEGSHFHLHGPSDPTRFEEHKGTYYFGSYKAAMTARREREKSRRAEAIALKKEERRQQAEARRAERALRKSEAASARSKRKAKTTTTATNTAGSTTPTKAKSSKAKSKSTKKGFRSWMDRRRGR